MIFQSDQRSPPCMRDMFFPEAGFHVSPAFRIWWRNIRHCKSGPRRRYAGKGNL